MPEGPEIRRAADQIAKVLVGAQLKKVNFAFDHLHVFEDTLTKSNIIRIDTRGKAMLTVFANDWVIYSHNQLYGVWKVVNKKGIIANTKRQLRLTIETELGSALLYSASDISVMRLNEVDKHPFISKLGPDILSEKPSVRDIVTLFQSTNYRNKQLAALLLDQHFLAGLGNYLRAEILHHAKLHPSLKPIQCSTNELSQLAKSILSLTNRSYRTGGITNPPSLVKKLKSEGKTHKESYRFSCYGREDQVCYHCQDNIQKEMRSGRTIYFCPTCQPLSLKP